MVVRSCTALAFGAALALVSARGASDPPPQKRQKAPVDCRVQGLAEPRANAPIEDSLGRVIARFSGAPARLIVDSFPAQPGGRVRVTTGTGKGSFRLQGFTALHELSLYATLPLAVSQGHLWIAPGKHLTFVSSAPGSIQVEPRVSRPFAQSFRAWAPCSALALAPGTPTKLTPKDDRTGYVLRGSELELLADPRRTETRVTTLKRAADAAPVLFFGSELRGEWLRVEYRGDVIIDAWARARDLEAVPRGEVIVELAPDTGAAGSARLAVQGDPRVVKALREVGIRTRASESEAPIGVIEPEAEAYVLDVVAGWVSVMPKGLEVVPRPDGQFWVRADELGM
jgi:hypothetical protein